MFLTKDKESRGQLANPGLPQKNGCQKGVCVCVYKDQKGNGRLWETCGLRFVTRHGSSLLA